MTPRTGNWWRRPPETEKSRHELQVYSDMLYAKNVLEPEAEKKREEERKKLLEERKKGNK